MRKRNLLTAGLALGALLACGFFFFQGVSYRFINNGMVLAGNGTTEPILGFEPNLGSGYDVSVVRSGSGEANLVAANGWQINGGSAITTDSPSDGYAFIPPSKCWMTAATTAFASGPALKMVAANNLVLSGTTNTTAGTIELTCSVNFDTRLTSGKGRTIADASILYGVQTTALSSIAAATADTVTWPAASTSSGATLASAGGTITATPGTLQLATTTAGQCYNEKLAFGTPIALNTDLQGLTLDQVFTTAGSTATTLQVCGVLVHYTNTIL